MQPKLGIIAAGGAVPVHVMNHCRDSGRDVFVLALQGHADELELDGVPHARIRLGAAGKMISALHDAKAEEVVLIGQLRRPSLLELRPDVRAAKIAFKARIAAHGDNSLLSAIVRELEGEGFRIVGVDDVVADMLAPTGVLGKISPDKLAGTDIQRGIEVVRGLGQLDVGQAAIVQDGIVLAVEAAEGTDRMIERSKALHRDGPGGVLVKCKKPGQDRRVDLPTIGRTTVEIAAAAGLRGIAVEAGATLIIERDAVIRAADTAGVFVTGVDLT